ncbi:MAG: tRNA (N(6)-L-threonylcarbamoyladenosine(37)-C(2))-methylthiotransferase MtaB [Planctomycetes bacterium]|jgi:threonylcarbamoyladenosine tRNA methylthiotransferase MtaB|nr:tRNA (N(6)-L-threonylcarbamoyladenosine(37)-C(2))-methylthiotransferase MtaB [Planctomycetota bacterium]
MMKKKIAFYTLGCKVNQYDSEALATQLKNIGFKLVKKEADLAIINTCAVTKVAILKDNRMIKRARQENPKAQILVMGCWPKAYRAEVTNLQPDLIWGLAKGKDLVFQINNLLGKEISKEDNKTRKNISRKKRKNTTEEKTEEKKGNNCEQTFFISTNEKTRYFIKVQDGCNQFCSYCIIPYTRGRLESRSLEEIEEEIRAAVKHGYQEIVVSGVHLGLYGVDLSENKSALKNKERKIKKKNKINLVYLLQCLAKIEGLQRIRLSSIEVTEVTDDLIAFMKNNRKMCQHLHISLQAGCNKILKAMNRPYTKEYFLKRILALRKAMPNIAITTDIIVGFPGESEKDFEETCAFAKRIAFAKIHVFSFSAHDKTPAFNMPNKVLPLDIKRRSVILHSFSNELEKEYQKKVINYYQQQKKNIPVVLLRNKKDNYLKGKTEFYFDISFTPEQIVKEKGELKFGQVLEIFSESLNS